MIKHFTLYSYLLLYPFLLFSQEINVEISPKKISLGNNLKITVTIYNGKINSYGPFPEIDGFRKSGVSSSSSTNFINGRRSSSQSIIQNYIPTNIGKFNIPSFTLSVNDKNINVDSAIIEVNDSKSSPNNSPFNNFFDPFNDPFDNFFDRNNEEFYEVEADAFLSLSTNKKSVFVGEGFNTTLSFYVSENNVADMRFYELGRQLTDIIKKIKPSNCWEENFNIENINSKPITLNNKRYNEYKIFEATYYPLNNETIQFPSLELELIKYKISKRPSFFGRNKVEDFEKFTSKPIKIIVKDLPPHPLKDNVSVGRYKLNEKISSPNIQTGESITYDFEIYGEGNISAISEPKINISGINFYSPNSQQNIQREKGKVFGRKKFSYYAVPSEPGKYDLSKYLEWIYFDPFRVKYDTLKSKAKLNIGGLSKKTLGDNSSEKNDILELIDNDYNELIPLKKQKDIALILNIITLTLFGLLIFFMVKRKL